MLDKSIPYKSLIMRREPAPLPPEPALPAGFSLRRYRPGDEVHWARIETSVAEFDDEGAARAYFAERFLPRQNLLRERCCFVCAPDGLPVATATAWEEAGERLLHWVSTAPAFQRRGLARAVVLHALHSYPPAPQPVWLGTQTWSHDAILLYDSWASAWYKAEPTPRPTSPTFLPRAWRSCARSIRRRSSTASSPAPCPRDRFPGKRAKQAPQRSCCGACSYASKTRFQ